MVPVEVFLFLICFVCLMPLFIMAGVLMFIRWYLEGAW